MFQIPDNGSGNDTVDAVVVDEESVGSVDSPGCGGKILRGDGALEHYLTVARLKENVVWNHPNTFLTLHFISSKNIVPTTN